MSDADLKRAHADHLASLDTPRRPGTEPPFNWLDHRGMPAGDELARAERAARLSFLPGRRPWEDVTAFDAQLGEITAALSGAMERVRELSEQLAAEPRRHADALSEWLLHKSADRPESRAAQLERDLADAEAERDALLLAESRVLEDRAELVERRRPKLVKTADALVEQKHRRMLELIDELERERAGLAEARESALWARTFPAQEAGRMPEWRPLAGSLRRVLAPLGLSAEVEARRVFEALRGDADWLSDAVGAEQRPMLEGREAAKTDAVWATPDVENSEKRTALEAARQAFIAEWGVEPSEMQLEAFVRERNLGW